MLPAPTGQVLLPDVPNWSWHEYGMRVGVWRFFELFRRLAIRPTLSINAGVNVKETRAGRGSGVSALKPFALDLCVTVAAVVRPREVWTWVDPLVSLVVVRRQRQEGEKPLTGGSTGDGVAFLPGGEAGGGFG